MPMAESWPRRGFVTNWPRICSTLDLSCGWLGNPAPVGRSYWELNFNSVNSWNFNGINHDKPFANYRISSIHSMKSLFSHVFFSLNQSILLNSQCVLAFNSYMFQRSLCAAVLKGCPVAIACCPVPLVSLVGACPLMRWWRLCPHWRICPLRRH